jgi:hypothetical protein
MARHVQQQVQVVLLQQGTVQGFLWLCQCWGLGLNPLVPKWCSTASQCATR